MWQSVRMSDQLRMHTPKEPRATGSREGEQCELDLTSVCVRSGVVQVPQRMLTWFTEGFVAQANGEELALTFEPPRALRGMAPFFEKNQLRANDRVRFTLDGGVVHLIAVRRERKRPETDPQPSRWASVRGSVEDAHEERRDARASAKGVERDVPVGERHGGALPDGPFTGSDDPADLDVSPDTASLDGRAGDDRVDATRGPWGDAGASVRAVRRVRIEGGPSPAATAGTPRPVDRADARQVWAKKHQARWRPLDAFFANPVEPAEDTGPAYPETTVRVIRRSGGSSSAPTTWNGPTGRPEKAVDPREVDRKRDGAERSATREEGVVTAAAGAAPAIPRPTPERLHPASTAATSRATEERRKGIFSTLAHLGLRFQGDGHAKASSLDAPEREPVAGAPVPVPVPVSASRRTNTPARELAAERPMGAATTDEWTPPTASRRSYDPTPPSATALDDAFGDGFVDMDDLGGPDHGPVGSLAGPTPPSTSAPSTGGLSTGAPPPVRARPSTPDGGVSTAARPDHGMYDPGPPATLEDDIALLAAFLSQPTTPAIVRTERVAEELGMSVERAEHALGRLSEDRERFDRIRPGAYMVRQRQRG